MRITAEQKAIIDSLRCERLSRNQDNIRLVEDFINGRNDSIAQTLRNEAFREDDSSLETSILTKMLSKILLYSSRRYHHAYQRYSLLGLYDL